MKLPLEGGCLCGKVRYRISAEPRHADYCHCRMCQRATGAPVVPWLTMASAAFAWTKGEPAVYRSSAKAERLFCPRFGTQLVFREIAEPDHLDVTLASLDDPEAVRPSHHIWTASRIAWFDTADDLPRYPRPRRLELIRERAARRARRCGRGHPGALGIAVAVRCWSSSLDSEGRITNGEWS